MSLRRDLGAIVAKYQTLQTGYVPLIALEKLIENEPPSTDEIRAKAMAAGLERAARAIDMSEDLATHLFSVAIGAALDVALPYIPEPEPPLPPVPWWKFWAKAT